MAQRTNNSNKYNIVSELQDYMFINSSNIDKNVQIIIQRDKKEKGNNGQGNNGQGNYGQGNDCTLEKVKDRFFSPAQKDSLFWCFYIMHNGFTKYEIEPASFIKEKEHKIKYVEYLRQHKDALKEHKIKPITVIEDELTNNESIGLKTFIALCILENLNIMVVNKNTFFELKCNPESKETHVVHKQGFNRFRIELNVVDETLQTYRTALFQILNIEKPLLSVSSYKLGELQDFCKRLKIVTELKKKQDLYNLLDEHLNKIE
jgi:hypothetical protein